MSLAPRISRTVPVSVRSKRPGDDAKHLERIRQLPCCLPGCGSQRTEAHHLLGALDGRPKGTGRKNEDRWAIPLCPTDHRRAHAHGKDQEWLAEQGIQARDLCKTLWGCRDKPDPLSSMQRVVYRAKQR